MIWRIPAKTFLLGEYAALAQGSAMLLTTNPCFEFGLCDQNKGFIHPDSPAGQWLKLQALGDSPTHWFDPYEARGGLGGSSAEFIGAYLC